MICASVREETLRAFASGLSPVQTQHHTITYLLHKYAFALCALRGIGISMICAIKHDYIMLTCVTN